MLRSSFNIFRIIIIIFLLSSFCIEDTFAELKTGDNFQYSSDPVLDSKKVDKKQKKIISEYVAFRVQDTVFFVSDLKDYLKALKVLECLDFSFLSLEGIGWKKEEAGQVLAQQKLKINDKFFQENKDKLLKLIKLIKVEKFVNRQNAVISSKFFQKIDFKKCISAKPKSWPYRLQSLLKIEGFLQDRFSSKSIHSFVLSLDKRVQHNVFY